MLKRKIMQRLIDWKASSKKAMLITGARQIGKSYAIREFAKREYRSYVEINLYDDKAAAKALLTAANVNEFLSRLSLFARDIMIPGNTLVFIDEVQEAPDIMTMVKFLVQDGRFDYVFSGSMLGTEFKGVRSYPVGYVTEQMMRPMDFEEFCWAIGVRKETLDTIRQCCEDERSVDEAVHEAMMRNFRTYLVVGGMPDAVNAFLNSGGDLAAVRRVQSDLNRQYRHDISQYAGSRALQVREVFEQMPTQLTDGNGRFSVTAIGENARYSRNQKDFVWLTEAGVALKTNCVAEPKSPLKRTAQSPKLKLYQSDTGMLMARYPVSTAQATYLDDSNPNLGAIYENAVAQELTAQRIPLYYYMSKKKGEVDFIADTQEDSVMPIEVKSGRSYMVHAAIDALLANPEYRLNQGMVVSRSNVLRQGNVLNLPLYALWCLADVAGLVAEDDEPDRPFTMQTQVV